MNTIPEAIEALRQGNMVIVVDNPNRENQGDVIFAAEAVTVEKINFLMQKCKGFICAPITKEKVKQLNIPLMVSSLHNTEKTGLNMTVAVDAKTVTSFGISAADRVKTIQAIVSSETKSDDLVRPGHLFPLLAREGGILERDGHTEATIELVQLAGYSPVGVLSEILNDKGEVADASELQAFAQEYKLAMVSIPDLIAYVQKTQFGKKRAPSSDVIKRSTAQLPTKYGTFTLVVYTSVGDSREHIALIMGEKTEEAVLVRVHSQCVTGETLLSLRCDCREQLHESMKIIGEKGSGVILYLNQEGRGIGLIEKIRAYTLQEKGLDTVEANHALGLVPDKRDYKIAADMLADVGITNIALLTNNPDKVKQLERYGVKVTKRVPIETVPHKYNKRYLKTKKEKLQHILENV